MKLVICDKMAAVLRVKKRSADRTACRKYSSEMKQTTKDDVISDRIENNEQISNDDVITDELSNTSPADDWMLAAMVIDRIFLIIFSILLVGGTVIVFLLGVFR